MPKCTARTTACDPCVFRPFAYIVFVYMLIDDILKPTTLAYTFYSHSKNIVDY